MKANKLVHHLCVWPLTVAIVVSLLAVPAGSAPPSPVRPAMMTAETEQAIARGLKYLADTQRPDGSWSNSGGYGIYPTVMTSLAGLALMSGGSTPESGPYARQVSKAMFYVLRVAEANKDGLIAGGGSESRSMYGHGFGMLFLAQCLGVETNKTVEERLRKVMERAIAVTAHSQSDLGAQYDHAGGWIYTPDGKNDEGSVTVTQLQALRAARNAGVRVPKETLDRAVAYLKACQQPDGGICYSFRSRGSSRPPISAAAVACFYAAGIYDRTSGGAGPEAEMVEKLVDYVKKTNMPSGNGGGGHYFYSQLYMAQGMYQRGGKDWEVYFPQIRAKLLELQVPDGSWNGDNVGTTYGTAIALMILQLPYGYLPISHR
jgi:hypothetical protein